MYSKTFCVLPFIHIATDPDGYTKPCCISSNKSKQNFGIDSIDQIINSDYYKIIRQKMHQGESVLGCETCYIKEKSSNTSYRTIYNDQFLQNKTITSIIEKSFEENYQVKKHVKYLDLRFGNLCNLKCRSCNPQNSTQLNKEIAEISTVDQSILKFYNPIGQDLNQWYQTEMFLQNLQDCSATLRHLYITGGEPTIIDQNIKLLEYLCQQDLAKNILIKTSTNLTNISKRLIELFRQFKQATIFCSIDGTDLYQEYLRYPSKWSQIKNNFETLANDSHNLDIKITPVIQNVNFENAVKLFEYAGQFPWVEIFPILLENPYYFDIKYLPQEYRNECLNQLKSWYKSFPRKTKFLNDFMRQIETKCQYSEDHKPALREFWQLTQMFDAHRETDLQSVNHRLWKICQSL